MNRLTKYLVIAACFVLCGAGAILVPAQNSPVNQDKPNAMPVKNHEPARRIWIQV